MSDEYKCEECGDSFDSQRGLSLHKTQTHEKDTKEDNTENKQTKSIEKQKEAPREPETDSGATVSFGLNSVLAAVFIFGVAVGLSSGLLLAGATSNTGVVPSGSGGSPSPDSGSGSADLVSLEEAEYPYGDLNYGVGSGTIQRGNKTFNVEGEPYIGAEDASITMVAYEDFECPFCNRYNNGAFPQILENNIQTGQAKYYWKNFPLKQIHPWAEPAGVAAECALNQDAKAFWIFKNGFFNNQDALKSAFESDRSKFDDSMKHWAEQAGLDTEQFNTCYDNEEEIDEVRQDQQEGTSDGVSGTPTVFVNSQKLVGAQPYSAFKTAIEEQ